MAAPLHKLTLTRTIQRSDDLGRSDSGNSYTRMTQGKISDA